MKPETYREQHGCHDCKHVFRTWDYDSETQCFCRHDGSERPPCLSGAMREVDTFPMTSDEFERHSDAWREWSKPRKVEPWGVCGEWESTDGSLRVIHTDIPGLIRELAKWAALPEEDPNVVDPEPIY